MKFQGTEEFHALKPQFYIYVVGLKAIFWNMNSSVWAIWAAQGSKVKKVDLSFSEQLVVFSTFCGQKKILFFFFENIVGSAIKSSTK